MGRIILGFAFLSILIVFLSVFLTRTNENKTHIKSDKISKSLLLDTLKVTEYKMSDNFESSYLGYRVNKIVYITQDKIKLEKYIIKIFSNKDYLTCFYYDNNLFEGFLQALLLDDNIFIIWDEGTEERDDVNRELLSDKNGVFWDNMCFLHKDVLKLHLKEGISDFNSGKSFEDYYEGIVSLYNK